jgi:predicted acetyltransferase
MWDVRSIREDEVDLFRARLSRGFGGDMDTDEGSRERFRELFELDRTVAAFDGDDIIGTGGAFSLDLTVPGGLTVPMGGTTIIAVQPTHTRRGVLSEMMRYHLDEVVARGEPVAGLWASESNIYGRFGYGLASHYHQVELDASRVVMRRQTSGSVRLVEGEDAEPLLREVYERVRPTLAGMLSRSDAWWRLRKMRDDESMRQGKSARRYAVYTEDGSVDGYATYRQKGEWDDFMPAGEVQVIEMMSATPQAHLGLWSFLTSIDLFNKVERWNTPVDDPLAMAVTEPRRIRRALGDGLWVRVLDVEEALASRAYENDGAVSIRVGDSFRPDTAGVYRLEVMDGNATCERVDTEPDVECDIDVLGHLYLGGGSAIGMSEAGRLSGDSTSVEVMHRMFRTVRAPWCPEVF